MTPYDDDGTPYVESDTSEAAAASMGPHTSRLRNLVAREFLRRGPAGLTDDDVEVLTGMRHQTASARRRELVLRGIVLDTGRRRPTRSGRMATVWIHASYAKEAQP